MLSRTHKCVVYLHICKDVILTMCDHLPNPADCGIPIVIGGSVSYTTTVEGSTTTYQCDTGLVPVGVIIAVCMENGEWDPDPVRAGCRLPGQGMCAVIRYLLSIDKP